MQSSEKMEIINNALESGPQIPFDKFSKLFKTWLEILSILTEEQRTIMFTSYINEVILNPQKIILFNLDGIFEIYLSLNQNEKNVVSNTVKKIIDTLDDDKKKTLLLIIPDHIKTEFRL